MIKKLKIHAFALSMILLVVVVLSGCSSSDSNPISTPGSTDESGLPFLEVPNDLSSRVPLGNWTVKFNLDNLTISISSKPNRNALPHFNLTQYLPPPGFIVNSYDPWTGVLDVDATITNSYDVNGYDLRLIVYTDDNGNRLLNADDWTSLHDIPGGSQINPFRAYAKFEDERIFEAFGSHTETLQLYFPAGITTLDFAIDASYPGNCEEPYEIKVVRQGDLTPEQGNETILEVDVFDWQEDVTDVQLYCPSITGFPLISFEYLSENRWGLILENSTGAGQGVYSGYLIASSVNSGSISLYDEINIHVNYSEAGWARPCGGTKYDEYYATCVDNSGNIIIGGVFSSTVDFDTGSRTQQRTSNGDWDSHIVKYDTNGNFLWVQSWGGTDREVVRSVATDTQGNIYASGYFKGEVDFDPGDGIEIRTSTASSEDAYLSKFDSNGNFIWVSAWGDLGYDAVSQIQTDSSGNIFVAGVYNETVDFDPGSGIVQHTSNGGSDIFLIKFDTLGNLTWVQTWGGIDNDDASDVLTDDLRGVFICGYYRQTVDFNPGAGVEEYFSAGGADIFFSRFDLDGIYIWTRVTGSTINDSAQSMAMDSEGNLYVTGYFRLTVDFDPGPETDEHTSAGDSDIFLSKNSPDGDYFWTQTWGGSDIDYNPKISIDTSNNMYITCRFKGTSDFDPGPDVEEYTSRGIWDFSLSRFNPMGEYEWVRIWGGTQYDIAAEVTNNLIGDIFIVGSFSDTVDFDPGQGVDSHTGKGEKDSFLLKLLPNGYYD